MIYSINFAIALHGLMMVFCVVILLSGTLSEQTWRVFGVESRCRISCDSSSQWWCWMVSSSLWCVSVDPPLMWTASLALIGSGVAVDVVHVSCCASSGVFVGLSVVNRTGRRYEIILFSSIWLLTCFLSKTAVGTVYCISVT